MTERIRARWGMQKVTILDKTLKKRGNVKIRDAYGFTREVPAKDLVQIPEGESGAKLRFGSDA